MASWGSSVLAGWCRSRGSRRGEKYFSILTAGSVPLRGAAQCQPRPISLPSKPRPKTQAAASWAPAAPQGFGCARSISSTWCLRSEHLLVAQGPRTPCGLLRDPQLLCSSHPGPSSWSLSKLSSFLPLNLYTGCSFCLVLCSLHAVPSWFLLIPVSAHVSPPSQHALNVGLPQSPRPVIVTALVTPRSSLPCSLHSWHRSA